MKPACFVQTGAAMVQAVLNIHAESYSGDFNGPKPDTVEREVVTEGCDLVPADGPLNDMRPGSHAFRKNQSRPRIFVGGWMKSGVKSAVQEADRAERSSSLTRGQW